MPVPMAWPDTDLGTEGLPSHARFRAAFVAALALAMGVTAAHGALREGMGQLSQAGKVALDLLLCAAFVLLGAAVAKARRGAPQARAGAGDEAPWF
jgi:hypothetical protein